MLYHTIDSVYVAASDLDACRCYERLGLRFSPAGYGRRTLQIGGPLNQFAVQFLANTAASGPLAEPLRQALAAGRSLFAVALGVKDLDAALSHLQTKDLVAVRNAEMAWLALHDRSGTDLVLIRQPPPAPEGFLDHPFPLKCLDHLAVVTHDLEGKTRFWSDVLGVPVAGEVTTPTLVIRQLRIGDAVLELLGPASADSPLWQRTPGPVSMASWEVADLEVAVRLARAAGFTVAEPAPGPLPGTRIATIQGSELAGVNMQLLQYV
jgi:catechol 2,3-dioxygenase-like lactoylglutathione lyase family enzyme